MNKTVMFIVGCTVALMSFATASVIASIPNSTTTGMCFDGSRWTLSMVRNGNKVTSYFTVKPTVKNANWIINYSYIPINKVDYQQVKSNSKGVLTTSNVIYSKNKVGVYVFTDNLGVMYCAAYGEI